MTENRYSGIPTIRREMKSASHPEPEFTAIHGDFRVCLRNAVISAADEGKTAEILEFCRTPRTKKELAEYLGIKSMTYGIKRYVEPLVESRLLALTDTKNPGSRSQKYYSV